MIQIDSKTQNTSSIFNTFSLPFLRNLQKVEHKYILNKIVPNFLDSDIDGHKDIASTDDPSFEKVKDYYDSFLPTQVNYNEEVLNSIENDLLNFIAFDSIDEVLIFKIGIESPEFTYDFYKKKLVTDPYYNRKIYTHWRTNNEDSSKRDLELLTIKPVTSLVNETKSFMLLFSNGFYETLGSKKTTILFSCILDFENFNIQIKYQTKNIKNLKTTHRTLLSNVIDQIKTVVLNKFAELRIFDDKDTSNYEKNLYYLFRDLASESEEIIKQDKSNKDEAILKKEVEEFIHKTLNVNIQSSHVDAIKDERVNSYINRVLSIYYQNVASNINENKSFQSYIYGFTFQSSEATRSSTSKGQTEAIYKDDIYWRLKDLIHDTKKIKTISIFERFNKKTPSKIYTSKELAVLSKTNESKISNTDQLLIDNTLNVDYKIESMHGGLKIHYKIKSSNKFERGIKNDYIIKKVIGYI